MLSKVREAIEKYNMLDKTECVTVALSGGADSVALLYALKTLGFRVRALHVNHQLRGDESDRDEAFVRALCEREGIPLEVCRADVSGEAKKRSIGLEECGREIRYELLSASAERNGGKIATAHTLSDNAETVLMNMARGCALGGLTGIPPVRGNIIRPLIFAAREQIEQYCEENSLDYVTDSSNLTDDYARNRIRHNTVPSLKTVNQAFEQAILRMTGLLSTDEDFINREVRNVMESLWNGDSCDISELRKLHAAVLSRVLMEKYRLLTGEACPSLHVQRMIALVEKGQGRQEMPNGIFVSAGKGRFSFETNKKPQSALSEAVSIPCSVEVMGKRMTLDKIDIGAYEEIKKNNRYLFKNAFDCDIIFSNLVIRNRRPGDRLKQVGRGITKELRRLMNEKGIPPGERESVLVLADEQGVIWAEGFGVDEGRAVTENTKNIVVIKVENRN